jgi:hypothetical protein
MRPEQVAGCFAAFVFAALSAAFLAIIRLSLVGSLDQFANLLLFAFVIAAGHAIVLGLPLFLLLRETGWLALRKPGPVKGAGLAQCSQLSLLWRQSRCSLFQPQPRIEPATTSFGMRGQ